MSKHHASASERAATSEEQANGTTTETAEQEEQAMATRTTDIQQQLDKAIAEREEYRELSLRKVAELENFRRRSEQERAELISYANTKLLLRLLPVLDDLQRAVDTGKTSSDYKSLVDGIELVYHKTLQTFEEAGVKSIQAVGEQFDVNQHEALMQMPSEAPEGQILQEAQRGYTYGDKILRHAKVIISAGQPQE
jgi:molecular chaperone GrpE